jgi:D-alanine-D-alanine ligase
MSKLRGKKIVVLKGGPGSEREVSLASARGVVKALQELGATVYDLDVNGSDFTLPDGAEFVFNVIHGTFGEDGDLQQILDERGIPYTGEGVEGSRVAFDKIATKEKFRAQGVSTPDFEVIKPDVRPAMPLPFVVKAPRQGSTVGVYIVKSEEQIGPAIEGAARYDDVLLVEDFISGKELTVGIVGDQALPIIQILPKQGFYDFANKYPFLNPQAGGGAEHLCPAPLDSATTQRVQQLALRAHQALGLEVYSRVDVLLSEDGKPYVLEINTIPGMTESSLLPEAAAAAGISYAQLCERIIELSLARFAKQ